MFCTWNRPTFAENKSIMSRQFNILLQIEGRSGARLNRLYTITCSRSNPLTNTFLRIHSDNYSRTSSELDIFEYFTQRVEGLEGVQPINEDYSKYDFNKLEDCRDVLTLCGNENGAMVLIIVEDQLDYIIPLYKVGYLLGPDGIEGNMPFCKWVGPYELLSYLHNKEMQIDPKFASAFNAITGTRRTEFLSRNKQ